MMKKILSAAFIAMTLVVSPVFAQTSNNNESKAQAKECTKDAKKCQDKEKREKVREALLLKGMNLSDTQKQQLRDLKEKTVQDKKAKKEALKTEGREKKEMTKEDRQAKKERKEAEKRDYLKKVRNIVGDDNYVIYLENQFVTSSNDQKGKSPMKGKERKMNKGPKGENGKEMAKSRQDMKQKRGDKNLQKKTMTDKAV